MKKITSLTFLPRTKFVFKGCRSYLLVVSCFLAGLTDTTGRADNIVFSDDFTAVTKVDNPWSGVDSLGQIKVIPGSQLAVDNAGNIGPTSLGPSVAVGDLNGDGLPDLVIADSYGFFWYFQNHGTKDAPKFTSGEIMPIWFGDPCESVWGDPNLVAQNIVPKIQLIDVNHDGKLDLVVGNYLGKLFYLINQGSASSPVFDMPSNLDDITIPTRREGVLWCNYLTPYLYDWHGNGNLDLTIGDGTYSANSIYLLTNKGTNEQPSFNEDNTAKIIPGMGREHLAPQVVPWNGDGKADILSIEREGFLNIFLNQGNDPNSGSPTFDQGHHVLVGGQENVGANATVTMAKLTDSGLPDLLIGTTDGHLSLSQNIGKPTDFQFGPPQPLMAANTRPSILRPTGWTLRGAFGSPYDLLVSTNPEVEAGFKPPPDSGVTSAMRFYIDEPQTPNTTFSQHFYPKYDNRLITRDTGFSLVAESNYTLSFWVRTSGPIADFKYHVEGLQKDQDGNLLANDSIEGDVGPSDTWNHFTTSISFKSASSDRHAIVNFIFNYTFSGKGSIYIAALKLEENSEN